MCSTRPRLQIQLRAAKSSLHSVLPRKYYFQSRKMWKLIIKSVWLRRLCLGTIERYGDGLIISRNAHNKEYQKNTVPTKTVIQQLRLCATSRCCSLKHSFLPLSRGAVNAALIPDRPGGEEELRLIPVQPSTSPMCTVRQGTQRRSTSPTLLRRMWHFILFHDFHSTETFGAIQCRRFWFPLKKKRKRKKKPWSR